MAASPSRSKESIPVIDLFAGPGGLAEGFSASRKTPFRIALSIEKDPIARTTLMLRAFLRQFRGGYPEAYYDVMRGVLSIPELYDRYPTQAELADQEAWNATLGKTPHSDVSQRIQVALDGADQWVLIGGPPCQAYSMAGRSRNRGIKGYKPEDDIRQYLYVEYLQVIADHSPSVFVMENVKGLLSASVNDEKIFRKVLADLESPAAALRREGRPTSRNRTHRYRVVALAPQTLFGGSEVRDFVIAAERHGIPQTRHRVILVGLRDDLGDLSLSPLADEEPVYCDQVIEGLPRVRSGISRGGDSAEEWLCALRQSSTSPWLKALRKSIASDVADKVIETVSKLTVPRLGRGGLFLEGDFPTESRPDWFHDPRLGGVSQHETRMHIKSDLHRYLFVSCFGKTRGVSPRLRDFPEELLPEHKNVETALGGGNFNDRFRVQIKRAAATTITSHIAKDGHYYIHYDPSQCRSLTLREAARLQTFPDNYFFCGPRTEGYAQVGNAVPPLLAAKIADRVRAALTESGATT